MATTEEAVAALRTNRHARAALGIAAEAIRRGYDVIDTIEPSLLTEIFIAPLGLAQSLTDSEIRTQGKDLLDRTNAYAQGVYATIHDDDAILPEATRSRVGVALAQALSDLDLLTKVSNDVVSSFLDDLGELIIAIGDATISSVNFIADKARNLADILIPTWLKWTLGVGIGVGLGVVIWRYTRP